MRKLFTLLALALTCIGVNAQETAIYSWQDDFAAANSITFADGATITITGNAEKNISNGARITVDGTEYVSMKVSNGAENTYVAPAGKAVSSVTFYSYVNKDAQTDRPAFWKEVGGTAYDIDASGGEMMCFKDGANPDVRTYSIGGTGSFTFTNTGEQLCYVMVVTFGEGGDTPGDGEIIARPKTNAGAPEDGGQYILVNAYSPAGYMSRTSWDGAFYFLDENGSNYASHAFTAQKNDDGTWCFFYPQEDGFNLYLSMPSGSSNLNAKIDEPVYWTVENGSISGFYGLRAGAGNSSASQGLLLHLNASGQYFVISEEVNGGGWYPDYAGGSIPADNDYGFEVDENGRAIMADHTSENWQFLKVEDVPEYMGYQSSYAAIINFAKEYGAVEGYEAGFKKTLDYVVAIYNGAEYNWEEDPAIINAAINAKVNLYKLILSAEEMGPDATLENAIAQAKVMFEQTSKAEDVESAITALENAIAAFQQGSGDLTALGKNMSFEDLSSQEGNQTSSVANPPVGWNEFINGKQVFTADDVRANGIPNWHGVNNDCNGEAKDGNYAFGIWTSGVPKFEINQTIEGLENGTYLISAGLMVGANGGGSRRTTQRIFGNLNSMLFASEAEYDTEILKTQYSGEIFDYANLVEPQTDTQLQPIEVRAYVYDGTLTFGLRTDGNIAAALRESNNGAGGDGWFKLDNFRIHSLGYIGEDAAAIANYFITGIEGIRNDKMEASLSEEVNGILDKYGTVTADTPAEDINNIIVTLKDKADDINASVAAYKKLLDAVDDAYNKADEFGYLEGTDAFAEFVDLADQANEAYEDGTWNNEKIDEVIDQLKELFEAMKQTAWQVGDEIALTNGSFEDLSAQGGNNSDGASNPPAGWNLYLNGTHVKSNSEYGATGASLGWCAINRGDNLDVTDDEGNHYDHQYTDGEHLWGIWAANIPTVELSQTFAGVPAGTYTLTMDVMVQNDWAGNNLTTQRIFANEFIQMYGAEEVYTADGVELPEDIVLAQKVQANHASELDIPVITYAGNPYDINYGTSGLLKPLTVTAGVAEGNSLTIGFRTDGNQLNNLEYTNGQGTGWFKIDNVHLTWNSEDVPAAVAIIANEIATGISSSNKGLELKGQQFYTANGMKLSAPQKGINIVKNLMSDGSVKTTKVMIK
ncbi:MAG: hypothetical protein J6T52_09150 [Bacteroidaceae bacterium]|nr:hypothetical protein [Bacteroidaceae bacterium]